MSAAPWRSPLARALHRNRSLPYARFVQLATVRQGGRPANRTVVFRGFLEPSNQLQFVTDSRSEKYGQIQTNSQSEICWYFPKSREQFRLSGALTLVGPQYPEQALVTARKHLWQNISDAARRQFVWPEPGQPRAGQTAFECPDPDPDLPTENFILLLLQPDTVDHLQLKGDPQQRDYYTRQPDGLWQTQAINP
jgi:PPOX class probable FMN-dependent enzyme